MKQASVVTIDGPVGSGKGTIASRVAASLGWHFLDSGALYRLVALEVIQQNLADPHEDLGDEAIARLALNLAVEFHSQGNETHILLGGVDVTQEIRREVVSVMASRVAVLEGVRVALVQRQRDFLQPPGLVADGRDMGTVIFPDAGLKIFLTASVDARARRRHKQLKQKGENVNLSRLFQDLKERDQRDSTRSVAPLKPAEDAVTIDSTDLSIDTVVQLIVKLVEEKALIS